MTAEVGSLRAALAATKKKLAMIAHAPSVASTGPPFGVWTQYAPPLQVPQFVSPMQHGTPKSLEYATPPPPTMGTVAYQQPSAY